MKPLILRETFERLLKTFATFPAEERVQSCITCAGMRTLLQRFAEVRVRAETSEAADAADDHRSMQNLLVGYEGVLGRYRRQQEEFADDFNLLEVMHLTGREIRHSMVLAWLLDHSIGRLGTHAQGELGFRLFLKEFGLPAEYANSDYWVRREVAGSDSIVDVEVACRGRFIIHIENKIWSCEGPDQTILEWSDLQRRAAQLKVSPADVHALFLTPRGAKPACPYFRAVRWGQVVRVLEIFAEQAKPRDVRLFAAHYARALNRFIVIQDANEDDDGETTDE